MSPDTAGPLDKKLSHYSALLRKWSSTLNLVAPATLADCENRHMQDSLQLVPLLPISPHTILDIGSGAGFPGLVLAMARPDCTVHLIESDSRKCSFLQTISRETVTPVVIHNQRVENVDIAALRPAVITARALAPLSDLLSMTMRCWQADPDMKLLFLKGQNWEAEVTSARQAYRFDCDPILSQTEATARVLRLSHIQR